MYKVVGEEDLLLERFDDGFKFNLRFIRNAKFGLEGLNQFSVTALLFYLFYDGGIGDESQNDVT